jgi:hypothetical protein
MQWRWAWSDQTRMLTTPRNLVRFPGIQIGPVRHPLSRIAFATMSKVPQFDWHLDPRTVFRSLRDARIASPQLGARLSEGLPDRYEDTLGGLPGCR